MAQQPIPNSVYDIVMDMDELNQIMSCGYLLELSPVLQEKVKQHIAARIGTYTQIASEEIYGFSNLVSIEDLKAIGEILDQGSKLRVAFTGLFNRGKTFCINKLAAILGDKKELPSGKQVSTRGISFIKSIFTLLDTMGTNAPLLLESIERAKKHVEKEFPQIEKPEKFANQQEFKNYNAKVYERNTKVANRAYEVAAINKKCIEAFLQSLIFSLAQAMVVVVNELTFQDQIYIEGIVHAVRNHLGERAKKRQSLNKFGKVIVLHNYVTCSDLNELAALKKKYVVDVYPGETQTVQVPVDGGATQLEIHESIHTHTIHLFIAKDGSPAGDKNKATFVYLKNILQVLAFPAGDTLAGLFCTEIKTLLEIHFKNVAQVDMVTNANDGNIGFKMLDVKELAYKSDKLQKTDQGFEIQLSKGNHFEVKYDIKQHKDYLLVVIDAPGICSVQLPRGKINESSISAKFTKEGELLIAGRRSLCIRAFKAIPSSNHLRKVDFDGNNLKVYACDLKDKVTFEGIEESDWEVRERPVGVFSKKIPIPNDYDKSKVFGMHLEDGVFTVLIKGKVEDANNFVQL